MTKNWWHKQWDNTFKLFLHAEAVVTPKFVKTLNDVAKEEIAYYLQQEKDDLTQNWNIYALAANKAQDNPHENKREIQSLISHFEYEIKKMQEVVKALKKLKGKL